MTVAAISSLQRGIVFVMAQWSPQAKWAYQQLTSFLMRHPSGLERLVYIDVDQEPGVYNLPEFAGKIHGYGETAVVRDGRIVFVAVLGKDPGRIQEHCEDLLRVYEA
jgi:hypothetical protein